MGKFVVCIFFPVLLEGIGASYSQITVTVPWKHRGAASVPWKRKGFLWRDLMVRCREHTILHWKAWPHLPWKRQVPGIHHYFGQPFKTTCTILIERTARCRAANSDLQNGSANTTREIERKIDLHESSPRPLRHTDRPKVKLKREVMKWLGIKKVI